MRLALSALAFVLLMAACDITGGHRATTTPTPTATVAETTPTVQPTAVGSTPTAQPTSPGAPSEGKITIIREEHPCAYGDSSDEIVWNYTVELGEASSVALYRVNNPDYSNIAWQRVDGSLTFGSSGELRGGRCDDDPEKGVAKYLSFTLVVTRFDP